MTLTEPRADGKMPGMAAGAAGAEASCGIAMPGGGRRVATWGRAMPGGGRPATWGMAIPGGGKVADMAGRITEGGTIYVVIHVYYNYCNISLCLSLYSQKEYFTAEITSTEPLTADLTTVRYLPALD
jgi:hypothetical protein